MYDVGVERSTQPSPKRYIELTFRIVRPCTSVCYPSPGHRPKQTFKLYGIKCQRSNLHGQTSCVGTPMMCNTKTHNTQIANFKISAAQDLMRS